MPLPVGQTIKKRYQINRIISTQGGFGNTYLAYDMLHKQDIVIKESKTAADIEQDALLSELRLLLSLDHPRLAKVYDGFFHERQLCVTMQYIPGRDVSTYLVATDPERRADPPDRPTALRWIVQTLEALAYLHSHGIIHCDVKPSNLRVHTETGGIFLLDFGISHHVDRTLIRAYSPPFSPPEQHDPTGIVTPASDIYAVGATLYMLLTGREPPYRDDHYDKTLRLPTEENQTIPVELENIVLKALCFDPADRYQDAQTMLQELRRLGYAPQVAAEVPPPPEPVSVPVDPEARLPYARPALTPTLLWSLIGLGVTLLVVLGLIIAGRSNLVGTTPAPTGSDVAASLTPAPTVAPATARAGPTTILGSGAVLVAPTSRTGTAPTVPGAIVTSTPAAYIVRELEVEGQTDSASLYVGKLPVRLTLLGDGLETIQSVVLQPRTPGQRTITLTVLRTQGGRVDLELTSLPPSFRSGGAYDLRLNEQSNRTIVLRDSIRQAQLQGIKFEYRYLASIRALPSLVVRNQTVPGPFATLYPQPDPAQKGDFLRNGDLVEILDETTNTDFYRVRVSENFDSNVVGTVGWVWAWMVEDRPPAPPVPGAIQMPYNLRHETQGRATEWLVLQGVPSASILSDSQSRERIPEVFDLFQAGQVVSSDPAEGAWIMPNSNVVLGVRAP